MTKKLVEMQVIEDMRQHAGLPELRIYNDRTKKGRSIKIEGCRSQFIFDVAAELNARGIKAKVVVIDPNGDTWYRIRTESV